jgi:hypothetical protein
MTMATNLNRGPTPSPPPLTDSRRALEEARQALDVECFATPAAEAENDQRVLSLCIKITSFLLAKQFNNDFFSNFEEFSQELWQETAGRAMDLREEAENRAVAAFDACKAA